MLRLLRSLYLISVLILFGCQYDPWAHNFLTKQPSEADLIGTYKIDSASQQRRVAVPIDNKPVTIIPTASIVLSSDHSVQFDHVPYDDDQHACESTGKGSWRVYKHQQWWAIEANIVNDVGPGRCKGTFAYELMLYGDKPPYKLHVTLGDPDTGDAAQFERAR